MYSPPSALYQTDGIRRRPVADSVTVSANHCSVLTPVVDGTRELTLLDEIGTAV
ncbi:MAG: hypothetical protein WBF66_07845 [Dehalococcoidia bacterium]